MFANAASVASGIVAWTQIPDPSEVGLFDAPNRPRGRNYELMSSNYTCVCCCKPGEIKGC